MCARLTISDMFSVTVPVSSSRGPHGRSDHLQRTDEAEEKKSRYFCEKYPKRRRPAEQHYIDAGITYFNDALVETSYRAKRFRAPVKNGLRWRWTLGQVGDEGFYQELEDMVDWSALGETMRRRLIPSRVRKTFDCLGTHKKIS